jgi:cell division protein FtsB
MYLVLFGYHPERNRMNGKAKVFLFVLACMFFVVAFIGVQSLRLWGQDGSLQGQKAAALAELNKITKENDAKKKELEDSKTDEWVIQQAHEMGMVSPGEIKIAEED